MRKIIYTGIIIVIIITACYQSNHSRIRILSSDDSSDANSEKQIVKEVMISYLEEKNLDDLITIESVKAYLVSHLDQELYEKLSFEITNMMFEAKVLKGKIIPAGMYETLVIAIDSGNGPNWWSLLYPEFFNLKYEDSSEVEYRCYFYDLLNR